MTAPERIRRGVAAIVVGFTGAGLATPSGAATTGAGPSSSQTPYLVPLAPGAGLQSIITTHDAVPRAGSAPGTAFTFAGIPDGLGAFDNRDGTYTILVNHELGSNQGLDRKTVGGGSGKGAFVDRLIVDRRTNRVLFGSDLIRNLVLAPGDTTRDLTRLCSGDLPRLSAFFSPQPSLFASKGTLARIYMNGEEGGPGRAFAHVATGPAAGTSYELARLGKQPWENVLANPAMGDQTLVALNDDTTPSATAAGNVFMYLGQKLARGNDVERAGLTNGELYVLKVDGVTAEDRSHGLSATADMFTGTVSFTNLGDVSAQSMADLDAMTLTAGTSFLRPEDGVWDPQNPNVYYFVTTDRYDQVKDGVGSTVGRTRLWKVTLADRFDLAAGGTITALLDGTEAVQMLDNLTADGEGHLVLLEDVGNTAHNGKVWSYDLASDALTLVAQHDPARFGDIGVPATAPFNHDEESSGVIPAFETLGRGWYLIDVQAHTTTGPRVDAGTVEDGQLLAMFVPPSGPPAVPDVMNLRLEALAQVAARTGLFTGVDA